MTASQQDIITANIPAQLKERKQWVLWKYEMRNGKPEKIPINALNGTWAKSNDASTWCDFQTAVARFTSAYEGIGYVFSPDDPFVGIDLDGCRNKDTGEIAAWASEEIARLNSYSEVSPSGTGVKIWITGKSPLARGRKVQPKHLPTICAKEPGVEVYEKGRFFAVTGYLPPGVPADPQPRQAELDTLCRKYFLNEYSRQESGSKASSSSKTSSSGIYASAPTVVERARKYVAKMEPAISGQGGHDRTYTVACRLVLGFDLEWNDAMSVLQEYNARCDPEWTQAELDHKLKDAYKEDGTRGCLLNSDAQPEEADNLLDFSSVRGSKQIVLVASQEEAEYLNAEGLKAVAMQGLCISTYQVKELEVGGMEDLLLAMDTDEPGRQLTDRITRRLSTSRIQPYVVDTDYKPADEVLDFKERIATAQSAASWLTSKMVYQHDIKTDLGLSHAVSSVLEYTTTLVDGLHRKTAKETLKKLANLTDDDLAFREQVYEKEASRQAALAKAKAALPQLQQQIEKGDVAGAALSSQAVLSSLRQNQAVEIPEPYLLADALQDLCKMPPGLATGYLEVDNRAKIPAGALTIVAGRPGHGKTAFMGNCFLSQVEHEPEKAFYFFSYEESKANLFPRLLMILAGEVIQAQTNKGAYKHYLKGGRIFTKNLKIEQAMQKYEQYAKSGRLILSHSMPCAEDLVAIIGQVCRQKKVGAIYVDYIQKVRLAKPQNTRYLDIKQVSQLLLEQAVAHNVPIILGAQLGRPEKTASSSMENTVSLDNMRESGDIEQDANLVFGLWNETMAPKKKDKQQGKDKKQQEDGLRNQPDIKVYTRVMDVKLVCLKNRDGQPDWTVDLQFDGATQKITDTKTTMAASQAGSW